MRSTIGDLLTPRQMAKESGWSVKSIRKLLAERRIRHLKRGNRYLIPKSAIDDFLMRLLAWVRWRCSCSSLEPGSVRQSPCILTSTSIRRRA